MISSLLLYITIPFISTDPTLPADSTKKTAIDTSSHITETVIINAVRADDMSPVTQKTLQLNDIESKNFGQDMPAFLNHTPSMQFYSDNGLNTGYGYMRLRGMDQTRLNYTLNGVSLSDGEDQGVYFSNFTDFLNSIQSIQIQRGVGLSSNGSASYAGSINFESINLNQKPEFQFQSSLGSYNSHRIATEYNTGKLGNNFAFYGRYSTSASDGYREHSGTAGNSFFFSGGYIGQKHIIKLTAFNGKVENDMAYLAVPISMIKQNRRTNQMSPDEKDRFSQNLIILQSSSFLNQYITLNNSIYYGKAGGDYDVKFDSVTMANFKLSSHQAGISTAIEYHKNQFKINTGINVQSFNRTHEMGYRPFVSLLDYSNIGYKNEASAFVRLNYTLGKFNFLGDLQVRHASFHYKPEKSYGFKNAYVDWLFLNPKAGVNYQLNEKISMYTSIGKTNREPTRNDMFGGNDNIDPWNQTQIGDLKKVKPESVTDFELGTKIKNERGFLQVNYYFMQFKNEITPIGALSYIGLPLRKNVASSYRTGIEIDWMYKLLHNLSINQNATWSNNKIKTYMNDVDSVTYNNVSPLLTPELIVNHSIQYSPVSKFTISLSGRYASKAYLDNTSNNNFTTPAYYISDLKLNYQPTSYLNISGWINNLTDEKYFTAGNIAGTEAAYFAMAGINYMVCLSLKY